MSLKATRRNPPAAAEGVTNQTGDTMSSFPRKRESNLFKGMDSRFRGNDRLVLNKHFL